MLIGSLKIFIQLKFTTVNDFISTVFLQLLDIILHVSIFIFSK